MDHREAPITVRIGAIGVFQLAAGDAIDQLRWVRAVPTGEMAFWAAVLRAAVSVAVGELHRSPVDQLRRPAASHGLVVGFNISSVARTREHESLLAAWPNGLWVTRGLTTARTVNAIRIVPYDSAWPHLYEAEARRISAAFGGRAVRIEHVGESAGASGLHARPARWLRPGVSILLQAERVAEHAPRSRVRGRLRTGGKSPGVPELLA